jgi:hypothetical protein
MNCVDDARDSKVTNPMRRQIDKTEVLCSFLFVPETYRMRPDSCVIHAYFICLRC